MSIPIDILGIAARAYKTLWTERAYIMRLIAFPFLIKMVCMSALMVTADKSVNGAALIMLPSYLADGWVAAHLVRLLCLGQRWPFRPTGDAEADGAMLRDRARGVMAGAVCYALIEVTLDGLGRLSVVSGLADALSSPQPPTGAVLIALAFMAAFITGFRYFLAYIPAAIGYPLSAYRKELQGLGIAPSLMGLWLVAFFPFLFFFQILAKSMGIAFIAVIAMLIDTFNLLILTLVATYAIQSLLKFRK